MKPHILISNDDGVDSPGIRALAEAVQDYGTVWVFAPDRERSAQSHTLTMHKPLRAELRGERVYAVSGTPADCVYLGLHGGIIPKEPALVLSGINRGSNLGNDVFYSGTVAAAMEGCLQGVPAIAFSLHMQFTDAALETARSVVQRLVPVVLREGLAPRMLLNVNIPSVGLAELKGIKAAVLGVRRYEEMVDERFDPRGRAYYWIGGAHEHFAAIEGSDGPAVEEGWATVTPVHADLTHHAYMATVRRWTDD